MSIFAEHFNGGLSGARNPVTFLLALAISVVLAAFIVMQSMRVDDPHAFVAQRPESFRLLDAASLRLDYSPPLALACPPEQPCLPVVAAAPLLSLSSFASPPALAGGFAGAGETRLMRVHFRARSAGFSTAYSGISGILSFPRLRFQMAEVYLDGRMEQRIYSSDRIMLPISAARLAGEWVEGDLVLQVNQQDATRFVLADEPAFLSDQTGLANYLGFIIDRRQHPTHQISSLLYVAVAVFVLLLFLIIESSPEALGLALYMGFTSLGALFGFAELRSAWLPLDFDATFLEHVCQGMADVSLLYFFVHLADLARPEARRWLGIGLLIVIPYAWLLTMTLASGWTWQRYVVAVGQGGVALVGLVGCARHFVALRDRNLAWKRAALVFAGIAAFSQILDMIWNYPGYLGEALGASTAFGKGLKVLQGHSAYLFALSTFINISTLENRVRVLSDEKSRAEVIKQELELGRTVQKAFLRLPDLPPSVDVATHHDAASYVSGDTYYVHWNEDTHRLVCLLNDVAGKGVQAALKAFGCMVVARSIWRYPKEGHAPGDRRIGERLSRYDEQVSELVAADGDRSYFSAMLGFELNTQSGEAYFYRVNHGYPLLVQPEGDQGAWSVHPLVLANQSVVSRRLVPGSMIVLASDGILSTSKDQKRLTEALEQQLGGPAPATPARLKHLVLDWLRHRRDAPVDDQTLIVLQWSPT